MTDRDCRRCGLKLTLENARTFDGRWTGACRDCEKLISRERQGDRHALNKLSERYAKALAVVEAARRVEATYSAFDPNYFSDQGRAVARAGLRAALAAFDEVADK